LLKASYNTSQEAADKLPRELGAFYQQNYLELYAKRSQDIRQAALAVLAIYNRNVFPDLKVTWGTYPNNLGHTDFPGCFRCHDGSHATRDGKSITQDCSGCHEPLAMGEASPEILKTLGLAELCGGVARRVTFLILYFGGYTLPVGSARDDSECLRTVSSSVL